MAGALLGGISIWAVRVKQLTVDDVKSRVRTVLRWQLASGVQFVRSHVDVCDPELRAVRAMVDLRKEIGDQITLQLVAFPQQGILSFDGGQDLMRRAVDLGVDVVGAIPHFELTREYGELSIKFAFDLAANKGLRVDIHCDETDDDQSRFVEVMAAETIRLGMDAIRLIAPRKLVLRGGKIVARTEPERTTVMWDDKEELVDFLRPAPKPLQPL